MYKCTKINATPRTTQTRTSESILQSECNAYLRENGILFYHKEKGRSKHKSHSAGLPDLLIWHNKVNIAVELKTQDGVQSKDQKVWQFFYERAGFRYFICRSFDEFKIILKVTQIT